MWVALLALALGACSDDGAPPRHAPDASPTYRPVASGKRVTEPAWLRRVLPTNAIAYLRVPDPWGMLAAPKGDGLDQALRDGRNVEAVVELRAAVHEALRRADPPSGPPWATLLLYHVRSPIELAVLPPAPGEPPFPQVLATAQAAFESTAAFGERVAALAARHPGLTLAQAVTPHGYGMLASGPVAAHLQYQADTGRVHVMAGMALPESRFQTVLEGLEPSPGHPMGAAEAAIDTSGQGLFLWTDVNKARALAEQLSPVAGLGLTTSPLAGVHTLAVGWGVREGKGRLKALIDAPGAELARFFGTAAIQPELGVAGEPRVVAAVALPDPTQLQELETVLQRRLSPEGWQNYQRAKGTFAQRYGITYEDLLGALGPEVVAFQDDVGAFAAVRVRDPKRLAHTLSRFTRITGHRYAVRRLNGQDYHHLVLPAVVDLDSSGADGSATPLFLRFMVGGKTHLYWTQEQDYLVFAAVPQLLRDRQFIQQRTSLRRWLTSEQRQPPDQAVALVSTRIHALPRRMYYAYLQLIGHLGDAVDAPVDLLELPTALQLQLPQQGAYGAQVSVAGPRLAFELTFENNPLEFLAGQKLAGVAALGIMAAIAVPAYQDYLLRARVAQGLARAGALQERLDAYYRRHGRFPDALALEDMERPQRRNDEHLRLRVAPETGRIEITYLTPPALGDRQLILVPHPTNGGLRWQCAGDIPPRLQPPGCRDTDRDHNP